MDLLARREYARLELRRRLQLKFSEHELVDTALEQLAAEGLLSDQRFAESYVRYRVAAGFGPHRIKLELRERGVRDELAGDAIKASHLDWLEQALQVRDKKFGAAPRDAKARAAQQRFLRYRGFSSEHIAALESVDTAV